MNEAEVLARAATILGARQEQREAEATQLYRLYAYKRAGEPHCLGKPKKLSRTEALLLVALERNDFTAYAACPNHNRWHGDATCSRHTRDCAIVVMADSRLNLLWALWASVSGQDGATVTLTEAHLR